MAVDPSSQMLEQVLPGVSGIHSDVLTVVLGCIGFLVILIAFDKIREALGLAGDPGVEKDEEGYQAYKRRADARAESARKQEFYRNRYEIEKEVEKSALARKGKEEGERAKVWGEIAAWARKDKKD